ncbi:uncharacterized protein C21orf62 homolog [Amphiprion ocellaris]|uniref:Uncharacterized protein n=1 Tax=Amphiprion ocellaris TaxID=80972 RepID=A0AAQ5WXJ8_AMPOC|nr:uncharacterized protein C21orf62 homolog [Amphiprion ocellaris]
MEMSLNTISSALLPWSLCLLFFQTPSSQVTSSVPTYVTSLPVNTTLLFDSGNLRNCSCSTLVRDCDEALANSMCRCHTVLRSSLSPAQLREPGQLTVWVKELWVLEELLNSSMVGHLWLSFCGVKPVNSQFLALLGLQTLRIHSTAPEASYPNQEIIVSPPAGVVADLEAHSFDFSSSFHMTFLDVAVLNGLSALKAYSVEGSLASAFSQHFPHLALPCTLLYSAASDPVEPSEQTVEPLQDLLITFVY